MDNSSSQSDADTNMFPSRLTPMELCFLLEDEPEYPMQFFVKLRLSGKLDRGNFESAFQMALARHPLLTAVVDRNRPLGWHWKETNASHQLIRWFDYGAGPVPDTVPDSELIDIRTEPGVRALVALGRDESVVTLQIHHAACDGIGASDFAGDIMIAYANLRQEKQSRWKKLDSNLLAKRRSGPPRGQILKWFAKNLLKTRQLQKFYKRKPVSLVDPRKIVEQRHKSELPPKPEGYPLCLSHRFSREESLEIQNHARESGTTLNTILIRDLFLTLKQWKPDCAATGPTDTLRLTVPVNLRTTADRKLSAANIVSLICLDRQLDQLEDGEGLAGEIDALLEDGKKSKHEWLLPATLEIMQYFPKELVRTMRRKRFYGTTLLSNLGPALPHCHLPRQEGKLVAGDVRLEQVEFIPVVRNTQGFAFGTSTYAGMISLNCHFDSRQINVSQVQTIFDALVQRLRARSNPATAEELSAA